MSLTALPHIQFYTHREVTLLKVTADKFVVLVVPNVRVLMEGYGEGCEDGRWIELAGLWY